MSMYQFLRHGKLLEPYVEKIENKIAQRVKEVKQVVEFNQWKVLNSFRSHEIGDHHFTPSTGYGYDDLGRDTLERVYADVFGAEAAIVRPQLISGTHAIATCLFGLLRPGDELIYITGKPYDTLDKIVGDPQNPGRVPGSLADFQIGYQYIDLMADGSVDIQQVQNKISQRTKVIGIQRSRGYANRPSFTLEEIKEMIQKIKEIREDLIVFVDNCYGEFVEQEEPTQVGADIMAGSLIKNPGGGLVKTGGYIVGKRDWIELAGTRLAAPGIGLEGGASLYSLLEMYQAFLSATCGGRGIKRSYFFIRSARRAWFYHKSIME